MSKRLKPKAPRFHRLFEKRVNRNVLIMNRKTLEDYFKVENNEEVSLTYNQFEQFPLETLSKDVRVLAATLERTHLEYKLTIYRHDPNDPKDEQVNVDEYTAWVGLPPYLPRDEMILSGSTDYGQNFQDYESNFIFIKKERRGKNHHLKNCLNTLNHLSANRLLFPPLLTCNSTNEDHRQHPHHPKCASQLLSHRRTQGVDDHRL